MYIAPKELCFKGLYDESMPFPVATQIDLKLCGGKTRIVVIIVKNADSLERGMADAVMCLCQNRIKYVIVTDTATWKFVHIEGDCIRVNTVPATTVQKSVVKLWKRYMPSLLMVNQSYVVTFLFRIENH
jgi:hypothetical protein